MTLATGLVLLSFASLCQARISGSPHTLVDPESNLICQDLRANLQIVGSGNREAGAVIGTTNTAGLAFKVKNSGKQARYGEIGLYAEHGAIGILKLGQVAGGGEALTETWTYNNRLQPKDTLARAAGSGSNLLKLEYFYCAGQTLSCANNNGNMRSQRVGNDALAGEAAWSALQSFGYDPLNRLTTFQEGGAVETNGYDAWGNRWATVSGGLVADPLTPSGSGWFSQTNNRMTGVGYDAVGNQTQVNPYTLEYDAEGKVRTVASAMNGSASYEYDGDGRRVKKTVNGNVVTTFAYDAFGRLAAEYGGSSTGNGVQYLTADHLGSVRLVTDGAGAVVRRHDYRPFGEDLTGVNGRSAKYGDVKNTRRFTSKERDAETGLDYFEARYLSAAQGRFTSTDPVSGGPGDPQSWNMYAYARNNPLLYTDPDGQTYRICDTSGHCDDNYSDANFDKNLSGTARSGAILDKDGNKIGTYQRTSLDDLSGFGNQFFNQMSGRRQASNQFIAAFAVGSVAVGTGGALAANAAGLTAGAGLTTVNLQGAAQAAALALPAGAKLGQMIARSGNSQFIGNPQGFLTFARDFVVTAVKQGTYAAGDYISRGGSTIYRVGNDFLTVARDGRILSYFQGANAGGVASKYSQLDGK